MGYLNHRHIIVEAWGEEDFKKVYELAQNLFPELLTPICKSPVNFEEFFYIFPDGSREGWEASDIYDKKILEFLKFTGKHSVGVIIVKDDEAFEEPYIQKVKDEISQLERSK